MFAYGDMLTRVSRSEKPLLLDIVDKRINVLAHNTNGLCGI